MIGDQTSGIQSRYLRTETRNLKIQDGEDVDVQRRPAFDAKFKAILSLIFYIKKSKLNLESSSWRVPTEVGE